MRYQSHMTPAMAKYDARHSGLPKLISYNPSIHGCILENGSPPIRHVGLQRLHLTYLHAQHLLAVAAPPTCLSAGRAELLLCRRQAAEQRQRHLPRRVRSAEKLQYALPPQGDTALGQVAAHVLGPHRRHAGQPARGEGRG